MTPFLRQAAEKYYRDGGIEGKCFIFPNRRSLVFFRKHLSDVLREASEKGDARPLVAPEMLTVNDFFYRLYNVRVTDRVSLLLELYDCYKALNPKAESLDDFIFWGDIILGDFNDVDKYLVDAEQIFTNVADFKAMQDTFSYLTQRQREAIESFVRHFNDASGRLTVDLKSDSPNVKERFLMIWNILLPLYKNYRKSLKEKDMAYEGMVYRAIAESLSGRARPVGKDGPKTDGTDGPETDGTGSPETVRTDGPETGGTDGPRSDGRDFLEGRFDGVEKFVFVGLNALNECEKTVMRRLRDRGLAEFCWDYSGDMIQDPRNRSSYFMADNVREFPQAFALDSEGVSLPKVRIVSVPSAIGQVKQLPEILARTVKEQQSSGTGQQSSGTEQQSSETGRQLSEIEQQPSGTGRQSSGTEGLPQGRDWSDCAVVLPDESLLMPLLNTIPPEIQDINVTMGYPMTGSEFFTFMSAVAALQLHSRKKGTQWSFYHQQVWSIFSNSIFKKVISKKEMETVLKVKSEAKVYVPISDLNSDPESLTALIFRPVITDPKATDPAQLEALSAYLNEIVAKVASRMRNDREMGLEVDFAMEYYRSVNRLCAIAPQVLPLTYIRILNQLLAGITVPFNGEPLKGLQIMGPLETRALDFSTLVIFSSNEGIFPRKSVSSSFIPPELRKGFSLPTYEFQDAVWAYYFYRMITRAENVWMVYDSRTEGVRTGEESRYIRQLEYHFRIPTERFVAEAPVKAASMETEIPKTQEDVDTARRRFLSATALQNYVKCPAIFYYNTIKKLKAEEEVSESMDSGMIGNVFHKTMQCLYSGEEAMAPGVEPASEIRGRRTLRVTADYIKSWLKRKDAIKEKVRSLMMEQMGTIEIVGRNIVIADVIVKYVTKTLERELEILQSKGKDSFEVLGLEEKFIIQYDGFNFIGYIDRLDRYSPDEIRVVDYKTGKVTPQDLWISEDNYAPTAEAFFGDGVYKDKPKIAFQLFIYDLLLETDGFSAGKTVKDSIYTTAGMFGECPKEAQVSEGFMKDMKKGLSKVLAEISDVTVPFRRTEDTGTCSYCDFKTICGR